MGDTCRRRARHGALGEWQMRLGSVLSVFLPVIGLTLLGARSIGRKWRTLREVSQLRSMAKVPRRRAPKTRR